MPENNDTPSTDSPSSERGAAAVADGPAGFQSRFYTPQEPSPEPDIPVLELPAGSLTFQQFLEREMMDPTNSPEMARGYMEMHAALMEGKLDKADINAIQLGRTQGMGGQMMLQKYETLASWVEQVAGIGGEDGFKITRPAGMEAPVVSASDGVTNTAPAIQNTRRSSGPSI